ncbi:ORF6N domain-containing protein [Escherichia coli]|uniref:ORF6N domain-containing protein n=1 Tax=Escherichia coli TaxID=562 RepID=UPI0039A0C659
MRNLPSGVVPAVRQPLAEDKIPVITTELLAQLYGTEPVRIRQNHHENKVRFVEGKHFFKVVGNDLKELRVALNYSQNLRLMQHLAEHGINTSKRS